MSWAAYHPRHRPVGRNVICPKARQSLFHESAQSVAMVTHAMDIVKKAVQHLNAGQTTVVSLDQPLYSISSGRGQICREKNSCFDV